MAAKIAAIATPTPSTAVSRGIPPATTKERKVTISTSSATTSPTASVIEIAGDRHREQIAADDRAGSVRQLLLELAHGRAQSVLGGGGDVGRLAVELHPHDRRRTIVAHHARHVLVVRARRGQHAVHVAELLHGPRDRILVVRVRDPIAGGAATTMNCALVPLTCGKVRSSCSSPPA